jgi:hypothetical protein
MVRSVLVWQVFVLVYKEFSETLQKKHRTAEIVSELNALHPNVHAIRHGSGGYWSHHDKIVAVDQIVAFVGGLDMTVKCPFCRGRRHGGTKEVTPRRSKLVLSRYLAQSCALREERKKNTCLKTPLPLLSKDGRFDDLTHRCGDVDHLPATRRLATPQHLADAHGACFFPGDEYVTP